MSDIECEKCPVRIYCKAYSEVRKANELSYHPQSVVRVSFVGNCPLVALVREPEPEEEA